MQIIKSLASGLCLTLLVLSQAVLAEEEKDSDSTVSIPIPVDKLERSAEYQQKLEEIDKQKRSEIATAPARKHKLTEEQGVNQLKYMMVQAWKRMEKELVEKGSFKPFGFVMGPTGEVNPLFIKDQHLMKQELALAGIANSLVEIAKTQTKWGVGLMYIKYTGERDENDNPISTIEVVTEHIAGWARYWSIPYKVEDGVVKMGKALETEMEPRYYRSVRDGR